MGAAPKQRISAPAAQPKTPESNATTNNAPIQFNFQPNILDSSANYTYHIRWSMCTEEDSNKLIIGGTSAQFRNGVNRIIIAESGRTAQYNIVDLSIDTLLPASPKTPQTVEKTFEMTIVEPYGVTLPDNLFVASQGIGIHNYLTCHCYFIELWFQGYNEDGTVNSSLDNIYKCWSVTLNKLDGTTTESGTTYKLEFLPNNAYTQADHVMCLPSSQNIEASNIGEFLNKLAQIFTDQNASLYEDKKPRITYKFQAPFANNWAFDKSSTTSQSQNSMKIGRNGVPSFQLGRGQDLTTILNFVISSTKDGQNFVIGNGVVPSPSKNSASMDVNGMTNLIVIHGWSYISGPFDTKINDYIRTVVYTLIPYPTTTAVGNLQNAVKTKQPANQENRKAALISSGNYVKHYFWSYTGKNLDINKFQLTLHYHQQTGIINQLGYNTIGNFRVGPQLDPSSVGVAQENNLNPTKPSTVASTPAANASLQTDVSISGSPSQTKRDISAAVNNNNAIPAGGQSPVSPNDISAQAAQNALKEKNVTNKTNNPVPPLLSLRRDAYLEDVGTSVFAPDPWAISGRADLTPITQNVAGGVDGSPTNTNSNAGVNNIQVSRSLVASILNQQSGEGLASQKLEIRGDPYWIGFGNLDERAAIGDGNQSIPAGRDQSVWVFGGDVGYVFTMRTGTTYDENSGLMIFNDNTVMWNGFYKVRKCKSIFKNGLFTQELESIRDPLTNSPNVSSPSASSSTAAQPTPKTNNPTISESASQKAAENLLYAGIVPV
jgi:hypothetical protein